MTASDLSEQPCNKSDDINKVVPNLLTTCDKQCEDNLLTASVVDKLVTRSDIFACVCKVQNARLNIDHVQSTCRRKNASCVIDRNIPIIFNRNFFFFWNDIAIAD